MKPSITVTGIDDVCRTLATIRQQAPFAMATALNAMANDAQRGIKNSLDNRFLLRRSTFVRNTIYRAKSTDFATKANLVAIVRVNPERDFLAQHEDGGRKVPASGGNVALPLPAVQPNRMLVIPKRLRPSGLRNSDQVRKITTPGGTFLVRNRPGGGRGGLYGWRTEFLYKLKPSVPLRRRLGFHETAQRIIDASWNRHLMAGIERALRTAR